MNKNNKLKITVIKLLVANYHSQHYDIKIVKNSTEYVGGVCNFLIHRCIILILGILAIYFIA